MNGWGALLQDPLGVLTLELGDPCRTKEGAPARYIGKGEALFVSASTNDLLVSRARLAQGGEERFPLPTDEEVRHFAGISV